MNDIGIEWLGDRALLLRLGAGIDAATNARAHAAALALRAANLPGVADVVPAYASVAVHYDPLAWTDADSATPPGERLAQHVLGLIRSLGERDANHANESARDIVEIPVCYGGDYGPDLADVARLAGLGESEAIARHAAGDYLVAMLGFAPGFPYLLGLDPALHTPRRASPRTRVPAGSVAIGGAQTGIYPRELPGGWQVVGRTPLILFDAECDPPALLSPGQRVRLRAIDAREFHAIVHERERRTAAGPKRTSQPTK